MKRWKGAVTSGNLAKKGVEKLGLLCKRVVITNVNTSWSILFLLKDGQGLWMLWVAGSLQHLVERDQPASLFNPICLQPALRPGPGPGLGPGPGPSPGPETWSHSVGWQPDTLLWPLWSRRRVRGPVRAFDTDINSSIRLSIEQLKRLLENYQKM